MNACERGTLCSLVKPCGIISLSQAGFGDGPVACDFSERAVLAQFMVYEGLELLLVTGAAGGRIDLASTGRALASARCLSMPSWQTAAADALVLAAGVELLDRRMAAVAGRGVDLGDRLGRRLGLRRAPAEAANGERE